MSPRGSVAMRFLLRMAFWLTVVLVLLPSGGSQPTTKAAQVNASDAMSVATAAASDMRQFCDRRPDTCATGSQLVIAIGHRAQAGAKMLYEFLTDQLGPYETGSITAPSPKSVPATTARASHETLTPADLEPDWRGPGPRNDKLADRKA